MEDLIRVKEVPGMGTGVFATRDIRKDELIAEFRGPRIKIPDMTGIPDEVWSHFFNVGVDEYIIAREPAVRTNHSCDPNAGIADDHFLIAMRDIAEGEQVTFDYSVITADNWKLECRCGSPACRKVISNYVDLPETVKKKYDPYTPEWIKALGKK